MRSCGSAGPRSRIMSLGGGPVPSDLPTRSCRVPLRTAPPPQRRQPFSLHSRRRLSPDRMPPGRNDEPRPSATRPAELQVPAGPTRRRHSTSPRENPRILREMPGPRNRTKPADGGGEVGGREGHKGWRTLRGCHELIWLFVFPCPSHKCRARRPQPVPTPLGEAGEGSRQSLFLDSCPSSLQPQASVSHTLPPTPRNLRLRPCFRCPRPTQKRRSRAVLAAPGADCFGLWAPGGGGRRSPTLPWRCALGQGKGAVQRQ